MKLGEINISPIWIFGITVKISTVLSNLGIRWIFKAIREARFIKRLIRMRGQLNFKIASFFSAVRAIASHKKNERKKGENYFTEFRWVHFNYLWVPPLPVLYQSCFY